MRSARNRSFRPELSGLKLEGRQLLSAAGGLVAGTAAVVVSHPVHRPTLLKGGSIWNSGSINSGSIDIGAFNRIYNSGSMDGVCLPEDGNSCWIRY
jgi:hypothetical protein